MDIVTKWLWLIHLSDTKQIPLLLMGIHGIGMTRGLHMTMTITMTIALIAAA